MKVAISGISGLVGSALQAQLIAEGHEVVALVRHPEQVNDKNCYWQPTGSSIELEKLEGLDAVIHLAGENIANKRWNHKVKQAIYDSRVKGTRLLCESLVQLKQKPKVLVSASAVGFYGDRKDEVLTETSTVGVGMLAEVCADWEAQTLSAKLADIRVVNARFGIVLGKEGGAFTKMKAPFQMGVGGCIGDGSQYMSWLSLDDAVRALLFCLNEDTLEGPVNLVAPEANTNREFTKMLGRAMHRPTLMTVPSFVLRQLMGKEMAKEIFLSSQRALPAKLSDAGFEWMHPTLPEAFAALL